MRTFVWGAALCAVMAVGVRRIDAQPVAGRDVVLTTQGVAAGVYYMDKTGPTLGTIHVSAALAPNWVEMWSDNTDLAVAKGAAPTGLMRMTTSGVVTSVSGRMIGFPNHAVLGEDGASFLVSSTTFNLVYDVPLTGGGFSTLILVNNGLPNAVCLDPQNGDVIVGGSVDYPPAPFPPTPGTGFLLRYDRQSGALVQTIATSLLQVSGVFPDREQGGFFVSRFDQGALLRVDNAGGVTTILPNDANLNAVRVDDDGTLWTVSGAVVTQCDRQGTILRRITAPLPSASWTGLALYGDRRLTANGTAQPGSTVTLDLTTTAQNELGKPYALAASFATRPGFRIGGKSIHLAVDDLFRLTVQQLAPTIFRGFQGVIPAGGATQAFIAVPATFPANSGVRIHVQGIVVDPAAPGGVGATTNAVHFTLR